MRGEFMKHAKILDSVTILFMMKWIFVDIVVDRCL